MSKAKKVISMILAVAMMLTMAPISVFAADEKWTYTTDTGLTTTGTHGTVTTDLVTFTTDTSATTDVIRVAYGQGSFALGTTVVSATPSGIPQNDGAYNYVAYNGETPSFAKVVFTIRGVQPDKVPSIANSLGSNLTASSKGLVSSDTVNNVYTYEWEITAGTANAGTDVVFTITYTVGGVDYLDYAYSRVEDILIMNGFVSYKRRNNEWGTEQCRHSHIVQLQSKNMYTTMTANPDSATDLKGYVNYAQGSVMNGDSIRGAGSEEGMDTSADAYVSKAPNDNIDGTEKIAVIKSVKEVNASRRNMCYGNDQNRGLSTIYIDKRNENLSNLNFRVSLQAAEKKSWSESHFRAFYLYNAQTGYTANEEDEPGASTWTNTTEITYTLNSTQITEIGGYQTQKFSGTGPTNPGTYNYSMGIDTQSSYTGADYTNYAAGWINTTFVVYDTTDLYHLYRGIIEGSGNYTCVRTSGAVGFVVEFNNGKHPQKSMYTEGWDRFETALKAAGKILASPKTDQATIDAAAIELWDAYVNGLKGYKATIEYEVQHIISGTTTKIAPSQTGTVNNGTKITANAASIDGYTIFGDAVKNVTADGELAKETITFTYTPRSFNVYAVTNNDENETNVYPTAYGTTFSISTAQAGVKEDYVLDITDASPYGWYYAYDEKTNTYSQPVTGDFRMGTEAVYIYAKWTTKPIEVYIQPVVEVNGTLTYNYEQLLLGTCKPEEVGSAAFTPDKDPTLEGYLFAGYYDDENLTEQKLWPHNFYLHDDALTVYGRFVDVFGKIIFESNGGSPVNALAFTAGTAPGEPSEIPTKAGYTFAGWYYDTALTRPVDWTAVLPDNTGFIAYAKWEVNTYDEIRFDLNNLNPSAVDTTSIAAVGPVTVGSKLDAAVVSEDIPTPRRLGYTFEYWAINGQQIDFATDAIPEISASVDANGTEYITAVAIWRPTDYSAVIELDSYEKLSGELIATDKTPSQPGDIITVQMTSTTNFHTGSSLFVFMYDQTLFDLVGSGADAFLLNRDNDYISGINAKYSAVTNSANMPWPSGAGLDSTKYAAVQIAIDPTIALDNYNTEPMADGTWMIEFQLKIKDTAAAGTYNDAVYMSNAWTRNSDNPAGTMFYAWTKNSTSVLDTYNNVVTPDLTDATVTIVIDETIPEDTTVTINTGTDETGYGAFADGKTQKIFTGRPETEIMDYVAPTRTGYTLAGWENNDAASTATWVQGYYVPTSDDNATYNALWEANTHYITFITEVGGTTVYETVEAKYDGGIEDPGVPTKTGYKFAGWVDGEGKAVTLADLVCTGDATYYATWAPGEVNFVVNAHYTHPVQGTETTTSGTTLTGTTGYKVVICETVPETQEAETVYVTISSLGAVLGGNMVYDKDANPDLPFVAGTVAAEGTLVITLEYTGKPITVTYNANGGAFSGGSTTKTEDSSWQAYPKGISDVPTRDGFDFGGWGASATATAATDVTAARVTANKTFYAIWTAKVTHVQFVVDGVRYGDLVEVPFGETITAPTAPTKAGWNFAGWSTDPNAATGSTNLGNQDAYDDAATGIAKTYYAIFTRKNVTITLVNGITGETIDTIIQEYESPIGTVANPSEEGYEFAGWDTEIPGTMPAEDMTITANFDPNEYTITFVTNGASNTVENIVADYTSDISAKLPADDDMTKAGYKFLGWSETEGGEVTALPTEMPLNGATYYAVWEAKEVDYYVYIYNMDTSGNYPAEDAPSDTVPLKGTVDQPVDTYVPETVDGFTVDNAKSEVNGTVPATGTLILKVYYERQKYNITYDVDGVDTVNSYYYEEAITSIADPTKTGYTFTGWSPAVPAKMPLDGIEVSAQWKIKQHTVTFYSDDTKATPVQSSSLDYGAKIIAAANQTREGYDFLGYAYEGTTDVIDFTANPQTVPDNDVVFVGIWKVKSFALIYMNSDSTTFAEYSVDYGTPVADWNVPTDEPVRTGYYFDGWQDSGYTTMPAAQVRIRSTWALESYTITLVNGVTGETIGTIAQNYNTAIDAVADPTMEGYYFTSWSEGIPGVMPDLGDNGATKTITANFAKESYTIAFNSDGGTDVKSITAAYGEAITAPADPTKKGYVFANWSEEVPATMPDLGDNGATKTLTAKWNVESYTIKLVNGVTGATIATIIQEYGSKIATVTAPEVEGYSFSAWSEEIPATMPDLGDNGATKTITANYTVDSFTLTFKLDGGNINGVTDDVVSSVAYGSGVAAPANPVKEGYSFNGWDTEIPATMPAKDVTITATWTVNEYTITFDTDGGTAVDPIKQNYGTAVIAPDAPTKTGYTFAGWDTEIPSTMPAENVTITAQWTVNKYKITFDSKGGTDVAPIEQDYNTAVTAPAAPTKTGYDFAGWSPAVPSTMPAENITLEAQWTVNQYTITLVNGVTGATIATIKQDYGTAIAAVSNPAEEGYTFTGWSETIPVTMPAGDKTITANFTIKQYEIRFVDEYDATVASEKLDYKAEIAPIVPATAPDKQYYTFEGWTLIEGGSNNIDDVITEFGTVPADEDGVIIYYPVYVRVPVTLTLVEGSTTVINKELSNDEAITGYIYGLEAKLTVAKLTSEYVAVQGDGIIQVTPIKYNRCGTGTKVEVIDNVTGEVTETYYIIIFGDINSDSGISATDYTVLEREVAPKTADIQTNWSVETVDGEANAAYDYCKVLAADLNQDGAVTEADLEILNAVTLNTALIDQVAGTSYKPEN